MSVSELASQILDLVRRGGAHNRLVVEGGPFFVVLRGARGGAAVDVEAAGGRHLEARLVAEQVGRLSELGLRQRTAASTFTGAWPMSGEADARAAAEKVEALMRQVYGYGEPATARLALGDRPKVENPRLIAAMERLAKTREMAARMSVYNHLVAADLLVALAEPLGDARRYDRARLHVFEQLGGLDVAGVFTDFEHLRGFAPRELPVVVWTGRELFPVLASRGVGSLLINPRGGVRGELYRNEIAAIAEGIARLSGVH
ncbi:MAG: SseB family protein [Myxococcales bacterium]|nr:SseB family protein [Myxococcales bacterium]